MSWFRLPRRFSKVRPAVHRSNQRLVRLIHETAAAIARHSASELRDQTDQLREQVFRGAAPTEEAILVPGFALMNEAIRRTLGFCYYDVQFLAGLALARGHIAEMQTGEGKTLVAGLPAFVHSLKDQGVHIITANSYLAARDCARLAPAFELLGITAKLLPERAQVFQKQPAYRADITYGTGYEFGFDYLRDQVTLRQRELAPLGQAVLERLRGVDDNAKFLQRGLPFAIIDEIDSVLIDDANSPLVLSEPAQEQAEDAPIHLLAREWAGRLEQGRDYLMDSSSGELQITKAGLEKIHAHLEAVPLKQLKRPWAEYVRQALRAEHFYRRNVQYIVKNDRVVLVDESTGRIFDDRHWRDGLHQAVEAKERLSITSEKQPLAQVTRQRFFRLYRGLCGMTGTATGSEAEFSTFYNLQVVPIPLRKSSRRTVLPPRYFADASAKWRAVAGAVRERQAIGLPVLVGTRTIADSQMLADSLRALGIAHQLLNGCQDEHEADIIARAGEPGTVTIATNMAGRGTDIKPPAEALAVGGLFVIGTERHDSSRVDRQLVGRSARQGDPGSAQFFLSADDALITREQPRLSRLMKSSADAQGEVRLSLNTWLDRAQRRTELAHYHRRRDLFQYDLYRESVLSRLHGGD